MTGDIKSVTLGGKAVRRVTLGESALWWEKRPQDTRPIQLVKNGNFSWGWRMTGNVSVNTHPDCDGWYYGTGYPATLEIVEEDGLRYLHIDGLNGSPMLQYNTRMTLGHLYYFSVRARTDCANAGLFINGGTNNGGVVFVKSDDFTVTSYVHRPATAQNGFYIKTRSGYLDIDTSYGIRVIDLTAMGCEDALPDGTPLDSVPSGNAQLPSANNSNAQACDRYFGDKYIPYYNPEDT